MSRRAALYLRQLVRPAGQQPIERHAHPLREAGPHRPYYADGPNLYAAAETDPHRVVALLPIWSAAS